MPDPPIIYRKACLADFLDEGEVIVPAQNNKDNKNHSRNDSIAKNQEEFGHKKRIKPWRTGAKSQQQITPKGHKKGFRG